MSAEEMAKNQVSYIFSKEVILKNLLQEGLISDLEYERYDQLLYDRYQMDAATGIPRPNSLAVLEEFELSHANVPVDYISLTAEAKKVFKNAPGYAVGCAVEILLLFCTTGS
nr:SHOCT domain-containing protein [uncultured Oscillibacter sp.]